MKQKIAKYASRFFAVVGILATALAVWIYVTYPKAPDVAKADINDSLDFMGSEDFKRMFEFDQRKYALALVEKLREKSFDELIGMMLSRNPAHREIGRNLRDSEFRHEVEAALANVLLDEFYEQPEGKRNYYLTLAMTMEQQSGKGKTPPGGIKIPSAEKFKDSFGEFLTRQPPNVQGKAARLIMDIRRHRKAFGMPDRW
jgi:hypothetical protein